MADRIAIFIDGGYLSSILKDEFGEPKIDYRKLSEYLTMGNSHLRTYYYDCLPYQSQPPSDEEKRRFAAKQSFLDALDKIERFQVRTGYLRKRMLDGNPVFQQKGVDVLLAIDFVQLSVRQLITHAVLLTADSDFIPAVKVAKDAGVVVRLYHSQTLGHSNQLWKTADERYIIDKGLMKNVSM